MKKIKVDGDGNAFTIYCVDLGRDRYIHAQLDPDYGRPEIIVQGAHSHTALGMTRDQVVDPQNCLAELLRDIDKHQSVA